MLIQAHIKNQYELLRFPLQLQVYTSLLIFEATCSKQFGRQTQNARHKNKAGQTAGTSKWLYCCFNWSVMNWMG